MASLVERLFGLSGTVALVTGSSGGIGLALAGGLAEAGARVVINGRNANKVNSAVAQLRAAGAQAEPAPFDVIQPPDVAQAVQHIETAVGPIDVLINNAGTQRRAPLEEFASETWRELMQTNLDSVFFVGQAVARFMIPRKRGSIINIGSVQSELARQNIAPYTASKGGVKMLTKGMATDWGRHGLRINGIGPGYFRTELNQAPMGRWGYVDELIGAAIFPASDASSFVNGHVLYVDGGITAYL